VVGRAIRDRRDRVILATKFGFQVDEAARAVELYINPDDILENLAFECERSLRHLGVEAIDLYQFHMWDFPLPRIPELLEKLEALVKSGKIRYYGWSTDNVELSRAFAQGRHCVSIQHAANVLQPAEEMFAFTQSTGLASLIRSPLMMGFLSDKYGADTHFVDSDVRKLDFKPERIASIVANRAKVREILASQGRTVAQGALGWLLAKGVQILPIPGIRTPAQATENAAAAQFGPLEPQQMAEIEQLLGRA